MVGFLVGDHYHVEGSNDRGKIDLCGALVPRASKMFLSLFMGKRFNGSRHLQARPIPQEFIQSENAPISISPDLINLAPFQVSQAADSGRDISKHVLLAKRDNQDVLPPGTKIGIITGCCVFFCIVVILCFWCQHGN